MSLWPHWVERLVQLSKAEAATHPVVRKLTIQGTGMDNPTGVWHACEGFNMLLLLCHVLSDFTTRFIGLCNILTTMMCFDMLE